MSSGAGTRDDQLLVLTFYVVIDVSYSMTDTGKIDAVNAMLPEVIDSIMANPALGDVVRFGAVDFSDDARVVLPLGDLRDVTTVPIFSVRGGTSFAAAFHLLRKVIEADLAQLKSDGFKVYRPAVFFITDGEPTDNAKSLKVAFEELTDKNFKARPNIIPFGVGNASKSQLDTWVYPKESDGGKPMRSYVMKDGINAADAIRQIAELLISSIIASANSVTAVGSAGGFVPPDDEDLDDWI